MFSINVKETNPLVHCITNYVTVNDVANILLSVGASPTMADCRCEVAEIANISSALYLNIGTANEDILKNMIIAGNSANSSNVPIVLDPVGVGASEFRKRCISTILEKLKVSVIRANISEIKSIALDQKSLRGVDAQDSDKITSDNLNQVISMAKNLSKKTNAVIAISGKIDIICDSTRCVILKNGDPMMAKITGAGCMLTSVIASHVASCDDAFTATVNAMAQMGIAGEIAREHLLDYQGNSSYRNHLIDAISFVDSKIIEERCVYEIK